MNVRRNALGAAVLAAALLAACAVKEAPKTADVVEDALPSTTKVALISTEPQA